MHIETVVLMLDNDNAGRNGTLGVAEALQGSGIRVVVGQYRDYWFDDRGEAVKDPDSLNGARLRKLFHSAVPIHDWARSIKQ